MAICIAYIACRKNGDIISTTEESRAISRQRTKLYNHTSAQASTNSSGALYIVMIERKIVKIATSSAASLAACYAVGAMQAA